MRFIMTRRSHRAAVVVAAAAMLTLSACGGGSGSTPEAAAADTKTSAAGSFPATVETKFGPVEIEKKPERVVALGWSDAEVALALGVQPVGASDWLAFGGEGVGPWSAGQYTTAPTLIGTMEPEFEKIAALKPDLILDTKSSGDQTRYDTLSKIATTVGVPTGGENWLATPEQQITMISAALGVPEQGAKLIADTKAEFAQYAEENPEFAGKTVTVGSKTSEGYGAYVTGDARVDFATQLGFTNNPTVQEQAGTSFAVTLSDENLKQLDADLVVMIPIGLEATDITEDPLYQAVPAVKEGRSVVLADPAISNAFSSGSPAATSYALEKVVPMLREALAE